jgi:hypothetical protein
LTRGCLARRILGAAGPEPERGTLHEVYARLAYALATGTLFEGGA